MAFDGIALNLTVAELKKNIIGVKVNKIFEPTGKDIIFGLYGAGKNLALHFCLDAKNGRINLTTRQKSNPQVAPNFCMLLRKHLIGAKLIEINTFDLERVCEFIFEARNELQDKTIRKVIVEIMSTHSNFILLNENNRIIDALKHVSSTSIEVMPARQYSMPENNKKSFLQLTNFDNFLEVISFTTPDVTIDKQLSDNFSGISRSFANHCLSILSLPNINLSKSELEKLYTYIKKITTNISASSLLFKEANGDYFPEFENHTDKFANNFFLDDFYFNKEEQEAFIAKRNYLLTCLQAELKKYSKRLSNINLKLKETARYGHLPLIW